MAQRLSQAAISINCSKSDQLLKGPVEEGDAELEFERVVRWILKLLHSGIL